MDWTPEPYYADGGLTIYYVLQHASSADSTWETLGNFVPEVDEIPAYSYVYLFYFHLSTQTIMTYSHIHGSYWQSRCNTPV